MFFKRIIFLILFLTVVSVILGAASQAQAAVSGTSTPLATEMPGNKIKAESVINALRLDLTATAGEELTAVTVTIDSSGNAAPTQVASSSFDRVGIQKGDVLLATTSVAGIGIPTVIDVASATTTSANGTFFVVLKTSSLWTDNGAPEAPNATPQGVVVSIGSNGVGVSPGSLVINATATQPFVADTHSQAPDPSVLITRYEQGAYYISTQAGVGEPGIISAFATSGSATALATTTISPTGGINLNLGSQYLSSVYLSAVDILGNAPSSKVEYSLPPQPSITSLKVFTDRIIFKSNKGLRGDQAMDCENRYFINSTTFSCGGWGHPFVEFNGNRVTIKGIDQVITLTSGTEATFAIASSSPIFDLDDNFPLKGTATATVETAAIPTIVSVSPNTATTGASVVVSGTNFGSATGTVYFSGGFNPQTGPLPPKPATTTVWTNTSITAIVPSGAQSGPLAIETSEGVMSDISEDSFFDVKTNVYFRIDNKEPDGSTSTIATSTNMRIFIGSESGDNVYYVGDSIGTSFNDTTKVYTVPNISSMGFVWAFDISGHYYQSPGTELGSGSSSSSPIVLTLQGVANRWVTGTITMGTECADAGKSQQVAVMAMAEGVETEMGPEGVQPSFFTTNSSCVASYTLPLRGAATSTFIVEAHLPPSSGSTFVDPSGQSVTVSDSNPTATANFTFTSADRKIYGRVVGENGEVLSSQKYNELWIFAYQPIEGGKGTAARPDSEGYFSLYVTEGAYKVEVGGPMMPFPTEKSVVVDSSAQYALDSTTVSITLKLSPPTTYISGYVKDASGNGISDVDLFSWCEGAPGGGHAFTDSQGFYKMYVPPCSNYHVEGFAPNYGHLTEQTNIEVTQNSNATVNFTLDSSNFVTISGVVTQNTSAIANVDVWVTQQEFGPELGYARTNTSGVYSLSLPKGLSNLYLHAATPGQGEFFSQQLNSGDTLNSSTTQNISVNTALLTIRLKPGNTFREAFIDAFSSMGHGFTNTRLSTSTAYDTYQMKVAYSGATTYTLRGGIPDFGPIPEATTSVSGDKTIDIDLSNLHFYTVSGTVSGSSTDAFVWARGPQRGGGTRVADDGTFSMQLREGVYDIGVGKPGYTGSVLQGQAISTTTSGLALALTKNTSTISGTVKYNRTGMENVYVWADNGAGGWAGDVSAADGTFNLSVSPGEWVVHAQGEGYEASAQLVTAPKTDLSIGLSRVDFNPKRKQRSIKPIEGGVIQTDDTKVDLPAGALGSDSTEAAVRVQNTMNIPETKGVKVLTSKAKAISASYSTGDNAGRSITNLGKKASLEIVITRAELEAEDITSLSAAENLKIGYYDSTANTWVELPTVIIETPNDVSSWDELEKISLKASTDHFSSFAPLGQDQTAPDTPTGLTATPGDSQVALSWNTVSSATKYNVYRKSGSQYPFLAQTTNASYTDTGLTNGVTYSYKVSALNDADQESPPTAAVSATPQTESTESTGGAVILLPGSSSSQPTAESEGEKAAATTTEATSTQPTSPTPASPAGGPASSERAQQIAAVRSQMLTIIRQLIELITQLILKYQQQLTALLAE